MCVIIIIVIIIVGVIMVSISIISSISIRIIISIMIIIISSSSSSSMIIDMNMNNTINNICIIIIIIISSSSSILRPLSVRFSMVRHWEVQFQKSGSTFSCQSMTPELQNKSQLQLPDNYYWACPVRISQIPIYALANPHCSQIPMLV